MINSKNKGFVYKSLILVLATIFSYSVTNSIVVSNISGIDEFGSIAFAKEKGGKGGKGGNSGSSGSSSSSGNSKADKATDKAAKQAEKSANVCG